MQKRFLVIIIIIIIIMTFILFLLFFTFKSLRDQYNHDVERKVDSFQNKIFVNEDIQKSYFKIKFRKRNKSPTCTFLQVDLNLRNRQTRRILCLRAYYLGDSFYLGCHNRY